MDHWHNLSVPYDATQHMTGSVSVGQSLIVPTEPAYNLADLATKCRRYSMGGRSCFGWPQSRP